MLVYQRVSLGYLLVNVYRKRTGKIHHATNGKTHYKSMAMFNSKLFVYQRVPGRNGALLSALTTSAYDGVRCRSTAGQQLEKHRENVPLW